MHKRVGDIEEFEFDRLETCPVEVDNNNKSLCIVSTTNQQLHISILISGWLKDERYDLLHTSYWHLSVVYSVTSTNKINMNKLSVAFANVKTQIL